MKRVRQERSTHRLLAAQLACDVEGDRLLGADDVADAVPVVSDGTKAAAGARLKGGEGAGGHERENFVILSFHKNPRLKTNLVEIVAKVEKRRLLDRRLAGGEVPGHAQDFVEERRGNTAPLGHDIKTEQVAVNSAWHGRRGAT